MNGTYWIGVLLSGLAATVGIAVAAQDPAPAPNYTPPGQRVDIGGRSLHLHCTGKGGPTVVFESGAGDFSIDWALVQPGVATFTRACSYDRAGFAWSDPGPQPRTSHQIALELHTALQKAGIKGPYVLVGQSFGGFLVRAFARYYPKQVVGMVLVDCLHEDQRIVMGDKVARIRDTATGRTAPAPQIALTEAGPPAPRKPQVGATQPVLPVPTEKAQVGPWLEKLHRWAAAQPGYRETWAAEMDWSPEDVADLYAHRGSPEYRLGDMPLIVLTRGELGYNNPPGVPAAELDAERKALQVELTRLSTNSKQIIAAKSGHNIQYDDPGLVVDAIRQVVEAVRHHTRLTPSSAP